MNSKRNILIVGGGTAGWLAAAYLAKFFDIGDQQQLNITLLESSDIGIIGVGEGTFPTIRNTLKFLGIDEAQFMRQTSATFKQGIRFADWVKTPHNGQHEHYFHPFEAPFYTEGAGLLPYWLLQDEATRLPFAQAVTFQKRVAEAQRAPKRPHEGDFTGPLNYAYHFDSVKLAHVLAERAKALGVRHLSGTLKGVELDDTGAIDRIMTHEHGSLTADLYIDCTGFHAELIGKALDAPFHSVRQYLFTNRSVTCKIPYDKPDAPIESYTVSTAHEAGWTWDIGLDGMRGIGYVYSSDHATDADAEATLRRYIGPKPYELQTRVIPFEPGYRTTQWVKNCVAVGLSGGFMEPLESTGVVMIEVAISMIAELFPHNGPIDAPAARFNELMVKRYDNIINFLKLHYALSQREEPFWRDNTDPASVPERLRELLEQWRYRPPNRFDFLLDLESFAFFNYQYILYGMGFKTDLSGGRSNFPNAAETERIFARITSYGERATKDLPAHRTLIRQIYDQGFSEKAPVMA
ncbi:tryptophan 7-halogenase [Asticcacaulis sp. SL142]|uniref:tryptophan halogenase family protein n=1 Tax=Asticcacaulis sp. SL142 TaxID=2995155 RepID=UPI00226D0367|nr:tryptophan halogenase family protein [Asticcacaulis sp. SL142]WAC47955.1 tryptophan 7-halogenase [Asticcacaulis sp. SL142]